MANLTAHLTELKSKIEVLKVKNQNDATTLQDSKKATKSFKVLMDKVIAGDNSKKLGKEMNELMPLLSKARRTEQIEMYENTLTLDLMQVNTRYVMLEADKKIVSPAGFHPDTMIYTKPKGVVILTDKLPKVSNLNYYDLKQV
tara:strand:- start:46 stop:474 length:429 start_codon:yes stop_codon:yes gene_type:complete